MQQGFIPRRMRFLNWRCRDQLLQADIIGHKTEHQTEAAASTPLHPLARFGASYQPTFQIAAAA